jgi:hypothetical protein
MKTLTTIISALIAVSATAFSAPSQATMAYRTTVNNGSVTCAGATQFNQNMLANNADGTKNTTLNTAVVQCGGVSTPFNNNGDVIVYEVGLDNLTASSVTINCSLTDGLGNAGGTIDTFYPKSVTIPANSSAWIDWNGTDTGGTTWDNGTPFMYPSMSCQLPNKTQVSYSAIIYQVDVGA